MRLLNSAARSNKRSAQLAYSSLQPLMLDEQSRRKKARKIVAVVTHFTGGADLSGLRTLDVGCSAGYIADELRQHGAIVTGVDIDTSGLARAAERFGPSVGFVSAAGDALPVEERSIDLVIFNHIYEHTVDADMVMVELRRVLKPGGIIYLGLGNRFGIMEPHYRLPFLSWLPGWAADVYVRAFHRAPFYHERFRTRRGLMRMCAGLNLWEYTYTLLGDPQTFAADDMVGKRLAPIPLFAWRALTPIMPTFVWVGVPGARSPAGPTPRVPPVRIANA